MKKKIINILFITISLFIVGTFAFSDSASAASFHHMTAHFMYKLTKLPKYVVQKTVNTHKSLYTLQVIHNDIIVRRVAKTRHHKKIKFSSKHQLRLKNFGHTQTWLYAGNNSWLVGAKPVKHPSENYYWDTEIARVKYPKKRKTISKLHNLPRLTHLNYATDMAQKDYPLLKRSEVAISPNRRWLLIGTVDTKNNGHFAIYNFKEINSKLNQAAHHSKKTVNLKYVKSVSAFHINKFFGTGPNQVNSIQGYEIDNKKAIYISRELKPVSRNSSFPREVVKIPWNATNSSDWTRYKINNSHWKKVATELEGIELSGKNINLTVAYHKRNKSHDVIGNRVYKLKNIAN